MTKRYDCTDIDLRMQFVLDGGLPEHEEHLFFGHLAGCSDCRLLYLSMALTEDAAEHGAEDAAEHGAEDAAMATNPPAPVPPIDPSDLEQLAWRTSAWRMVSVAAAAVLVGALAGSLAGSQLGAREPERRLAIVAQASAHQAQRVRDLESQIASQAKQLEQVRDDLAASQAAQPPEVAELTAQLHTAMQRISEQDQNIEELRKDNARLSAALAKERAGKNAVFAPGASCKAKTTRMEFEPSDQSATCGTPSSASYLDPSTQRVYWTVKLRGEMKSCTCEPGP